MGRKPLPKGEKREVISISLKPTTIEAIEALRGDTPRSRWLEECIDHLQAIAGAYGPRGFIQCDNCYKVQNFGHFVSGDEAQCTNFRCSLKLTKWFEVKVIQ